VSESAPLAKETLALFDTPRFTVTLPPVIT
jgi:hypothetical protein